MSIVNGNGWLGIELAHICWSWRLAMLTVVCRSRLPLMHVLHYHIELIRDGGFEGCHACLQSG